MARRPIGLATAGVQVHQMLQGNNGWPKTVLCLKYVLEIAQLVHSLATILLTRSAGSPDSFIARRDKKHRHHSRLTATPALA